jgi:hypothetical protein
VEKVISDSRPRHKGRLPPVVSSLFSIKAAHWRDGIRGTELGARGKERTARQRRVIRVKGSASRGEGSSTSMSTRKNAEARFALSVNCYRPRKRLRLTRRGIEHEHEHDHEFNPGRGCLRSVD